MVDTLKKLLGIGLKPHKYDVGTIILFCDYRNDGKPYDGIDLIDRMVPRKRAGCITRKTRVDELPTYYVILFNSNQGVLYNVPEKNLELYSETVDV